MTAARVHPVRCEVVRRRRRTATAWTAVAVGVLGISLAAPIGSATAAPALAVAFWRAAGGALATGAVVGVRGRSELRALPGSAWRRSGLAGVLLAAHFALWIPSLRLTSVAASTALVATTPVWTVAADRLTGRPASGRILAGVAVALAGMLAITGADAGRAGHALAGDLLALGGGIAGAAYMLVGERVRATTSTAGYTLIAYGTCAAVLFPVCVLGGVPLAGWHLRTWVELAVLTLAAQLAGHSLLNAALPVVGSTPLALAILLEVPGAVLVAWLWLGSTPSWAVLPGTVLVLVGLVSVIRGRAAWSRSREPVLTAAGPMDSVPSRAARPSLQSPPRRSRR